MYPFIAYITPRDGIVRRIDLTAPDLQAARTAAQTTATALYCSCFTFSVWPA